MTHLTQELGIHLRLRQRIQELFPNTDEETLTDTIEGLTRLDEVLAEVVRSTLHDEALAEALKARISGMRARLDRLEAGAETKRAAIAAAMSDAQMRIFTMPEATVSLRDLPPKLVVTDEDAIPEAYWKPQPSKLDRRELTDALKAGASLPGAVLGNGGVTLAVRVK